MVEAKPLAGGLVREEKDWNALYAGCFDPSQPVTFLREEFGETVAPELKSSPVRRSSSTFASKHISPHKSARKPPLCLKPTNDWKQRLTLVHKSNQKVKTVQTSAGSLMIVPMKRGRGRPPKNGPPPPQRIIVIPPLLKDNSTTSMANSTSLSREQFAIERPLHFLHHVPHCDAHEFDLGIVDFEICNDPMSSVDYDMDEQDFLWLKQMNDERKIVGLLRVSEDDFEYCMDRLEKYWFHLTKAFQKWQSRIEDTGSPEDFLCEICGDGETTSTNLIVMCDGCDLPVHQECYGVVHIPEGPWLCRRCYIGGGADSETRCSLCPWPDGALKQTTDPKRPWAHLICAYYLPNETSILNPAFQEPIDIKHLNKDRFNLTCIYCKKKDGAPIQCSLKTCHLSFHPICARKAGALMDHAKHSGLCWKHSFAERKDKEIDEDHHVDVEALTSPSSPRTRKPSTISSNVMKLPTPPVPLIEIPTGHIGLTKKLRRPESKPIWLMEPIAPKVILDRILDLYPVLNQDDEAIIDLIILSTISKYWSLKRASKRGMPLLRKLQFEPWSTSQFEAHSEKSIIDNRNAREYILHDLKKLERICSSLVEMERHHLASFSALKDAVILAIDPITVLCRLILRTAVNLDPRGIFANPVSIEDVPDYLDVITEPMDLHTMAVNLESGVYITVDEFLFDLDLISSNAMAYNLPETIYYGAAEDLREGVLPLVGKVKRILKDLKIGSTDEVSLGLLKVIQPHLNPIIEVEAPKSNLRIQKVEGRKISETDKKEKQKPVALPKPVRYFHQTRIWAPLEPGFMFPARCVQKSQISRERRQLIPPKVYNQKIISGTQMIQFYDPDTTWAVMEESELRPLTRDLEGDAKRLRGEGFEINLTKPIKDAYKLATS